MFGEVDEIEKMETNRKIKTLRKHNYPLEVLTSPCGGYREPDSAQVTSYDCVLIFSSQCARTASL